MALTAHIGIRTRVTGDVGLFRTALTPTPLPEGLSLPTSLKKLGECLINALDLALAPFSCMPERL